MSVKFLPNKQLGQSKKEEVLNEGGSLQLLALQEERPELFTLYPLYNIK